MKHRLPAILLLALLLLLSIAQSIVPARGEQSSHGVQSAGDDGRMGLRQLLEAADYSVTPWTGRPGALPARPCTIWLEKLPPTLAGEEATRQTEGDAPLREALARGLANPQHYRRHVAQGGALVVEVGGGEALERLAGEFGFFEIEHLKLGPHTMDADAPVLHTATWTSGEALELAPPSENDLQGCESVPTGTRLLEDDLGRAQVFEVPIGRGSLLLVLCGGVFDNQYLSLHDHAVLAVRLAERGPRGGPIYLDESSGLGGGTPSLLDLAVRPRALPFTLALAVVAGLLLWRSLGAREIPHDPPPLEFMSPRTRTLARARLFERAKRFDLLADQLRRGTLRRIGARLGIAHALTNEALAGAGGARAWALRAGAGDDVGNWVELLSARSVQSAAELGRFERDLHELEVRLFSATLGRYQSKGRDRRRPRTRVRSASVLPGALAPVSTAQVDLTR